jgi:hypothetical protein
MLLMLSATADAQGLRVSTHVFDATAPVAGREQIVSSSLSLFHNGRVYDYVDSADEVVIFDPQQKKFTILNTARDMTTSLSFEEIRHLLETRIPAVEEYLQDVARQKNPSAERAVASLRFQLNPSFQKDFDPATGNLELSAPSWTYRVATREWSDREQVEKYLAYADWTARLNHIMHPRSMFPEPRLELNTALRELKNRMPVRVELDLAPDETLKLRAEHRFTQDLDDTDRGRIARWEQALSSSAMQQLSFRNYQQTVLLSSRR